MALFARHKPEPEIPPVSWDGTPWFTVTDVLRPGTLTRKPVKGERAVRAATTHEGVRYFAPAVLLVADGAEQPAYELYAATRPESLLCSLTPEKSGARYRVSDSGGTELGLLHRTPPAKRAIQHGWWLQQPGRPDIVARYNWARGSAKDIAARGKEKVVRGAGAVVGGVVDSVLSLGVEGDARGGPSNEGWPVTWRAEGEAEPEVLVCRYLEDFADIRTYHPRASWLDRRLALALAVVREGTKG
ncbi:hypothetical protein [Streptomyces sp. NPDC054834]